MATGDFNSIKNDWLQKFKHLQFGGKAQLAFLEDMYVLIKDGIPANRSVEMIAQSTTGLTRDVALTIAQKISEGQQLADGMREWFAVNIVEIIRVGEEGGALGETIKSAINTLSQRSSALGALISAIAYPLVVIIMACVLIVYLNNNVLVQFKQIKPIAEWPSVGQNLVMAGEIIQTWWWLVIILVVVTILFLRRVMANYIGEFRPLLDKFPPFSLFKRFAAARVMETMGLLVANGVVFRNAIKIMQYQATPYIASHLIMMEHLLATGRGNISDVLETGLIDEKSLLRLRVMAEVKGLEHGMVRLGVRGTEESIKTLKVISKTIGGILLVIGACLILFIIIGINKTGQAMGAG
jgi:type II secretory pathway component PulF